VCGEGAVTGGGERKERPKLQARLKTKTYFEGEWKSKREKREWMEDCPHEDI